MIFYTIIIYNSQKLIFHSVLYSVQIPKAIGLQLFKRIVLLSGRELMAQTTVNRNIAINII